MKRAEILAIDYFKRWVEAQKGKWKDMMRSGVGYDFEVEWPDGRIEMYEVKGTRKLLKIPDMSVREFDEGQRLKADFLFVVGNVYDLSNEACYKIPRDEILPENLKLKKHIIFDFSRIITEWESLELIDLKSISNLFLD